MAFVIRHEVANILSGPGDWTGGFARYHEQRTARHSHIYSTWHIVSINIWIDIQWLTRCNAIFHSIDIAVPLNTRVILEVVRIVRHAEVVSCSTSLSVPAPSSSS